MDEQVTLNIPRAEVTLWVVVATSVIFLFLGALLLLIISVRNRRNRHRAQMAEMALARDREVMAAEREVQRQTLQDIGRELHDNLGQLLTVARMGLFGARGEDERGRHVREAEVVIEHGIEEVRRLGRSLNSDMWGERTLADAVRTEAVRMERLGLIVMEVHVEDSVRDPTSDIKAILFRVFQEVVTNALKHAEAERIVVSLQGEAKLVLTISDDGQGFDPSEVPSVSGITNIKRRCALIGFSTTLLSAPGKGTQWCFEQRHP